MPLGRSLLAFGEVGGGGPSSSEPAPSSLASAQTSAATRSTPSWRNWLRGRLPPAPQLPSVYFVGAGAFATAPV